MINAAIQILSISDHSVKKLNDIINIYHDNNNITIFSNSAKMNNKFISGIIDCSESFNTASRTIGICTKVCGSC